MDNLQRSKLDSYDRVQLFDSKHAADLATIPDYAPEQTSFDLAVSAIISAANVQQEDTGGNTPTSVLLKTTMGKAVIKFARRGTVKAKMLGNLVLAAELDQPFTYIFSAPKTTSVQRATDMRNAMNDNLAVLTNIKPSDIIEIDTAIAAYNGVKDNPTVAVQTKKAEGTDALPANYELADASLENMYDLVFSYFEDDKPALVDELALAKQILNTGIRHTSLYITVLDFDTKAPIENAVVHDASKNIDSFTDHDGIATLPKHKAGHFHFAVSYTGKTTVDIAVDIKQGMKNEVTVKLRSV